MNCAKIGLLTVAALVSLGARTASVDRAGDAEKAYSDLLSAGDWQEAMKAAEKLGELGDEALPSLLAGTRQEAEMARRNCYEILHAKFPKHPETVAATIRGLNDKESSISYPCAFHLGKHRIIESKEALKACVQDGTRDSMTTYAAAKSLAELGESKAMVMLYAGLGSDDAYSRYLSNMGIKALCGKDLTDFGYRSPWEGTFVSGPAVMTMRGQPIDKARNKLSRWQAIVSLLEWLEKEKPALFNELDNLW